MKNHKNYENKIYKNETRNTELKLDNLFSRSNDNDEKAKKILTILNICFIYFKHTLNNKNKAP